MSLTSSGSPASGAAAEACAKVEATHAQADNANKEPEIVIEKARIEAKLNTLQHEKEGAAAEAENNVPEAAS